jgi:hypothetical protein
MWNPPAEAVPPTATTAAAARSVARMERVRFTAGLPFSDFSDFQQDARVVRSVY